MSTTATAREALAGWGWDDGWSDTFDAWDRRVMGASPGLEEQMEGPAADRRSGPGSAAQPACYRPARVIAQHRGRWIVASELGEQRATTTGRFRFATEAPGDLPAVGDWVACPDHPGPDTLIEGVLPRRTAFRRRAAGARAEAQVVASNVDVLLVAASLNRDLNERRLERYLAMARESGATPVVLLTKSDLAGDATPFVDRLEAALRVAVVSVSSRTGEGIAGLETWLTPGRTVALVGSSGVGKSTLLNRLAGTELAVTREIRDDDARGRHTTSHRQLFRLASGVLLLDTPGLRELGLWDADEGLADTFAEIGDLAARCRFRDCAHEREPGCAVRAAIADGSLDERRLHSFRRLGSELASLPTPAERREAGRRFSRAIRDVSATTEERKSWRWRES